MFSNEPIPSHDNFNLCQPFKVMWILYIPVPIDNRNKGDFITLEDLYKCSFAFPKKIPDDVEVIMVMHAPVTCINGEWHLICGLFRKVITDKNTGYQILDLLLKKSGKNGFEVMRTGGALGRCDLQSSYFK